MAKNYTAQNLMLYDALWLEQKNEPNHNKERVVNDDIDSKDIPEVNKSRQMEWAKVLHR